MTSDRVSEEAELERLRRIVHDYGEALMDIAGHRENCPYAKASGCEVSMQDRAAAVLELDGTEATA